MILFEAAWLLALLAVCAPAQVPKPRNPPPTPVQPLAFSHKVHAADGIACRSCHQIKEPGWEAGLPTIERCVSCHNKNRRNTPVVQKLAEYQKQAEEIPWARVYKLETWVDFSHKEHLATGKATCETCHGPVRDRDVLSLEKDISMVGCVYCHNDTDAPKNCSYCHLP